MTLYFPLTHKRSIQTFHTHRVKLVTNVPLKLDWMLFLSYGVEAELISPRRAPFGESCYSFCKTTLCKKNESSCMCCSLVKCFAKFRSKKSKRNLEKLLLQLVCGEFLAHSVSVFSF